MRTRPPFVIAALIFVFVAFLPGIAFVALSNMPGWRLGPWLIGPVVVAAILLAFETVSRLGPKAFEAPLAYLFKRYPLRRDRLTLLIAGILALAVGSAPISMTPQLYFFLARPLVMLLLAIGLCWAFGTPALRGDVLRFVPRSNWGRKT